MIGNRSPVPRLRFHEHQRPDAVDNLPRQQRIVGSSPLGVQLLRLSRTARYPAVFYLPWVEALCLGKGDVPSSSISFSLGQHLSSRLCERLAPEGRRKSFRRPLPLSTPNCQRSRRKRMCDSSRRGSFSYAPLVIAIGHRVWAISLGAVSLCIRFFVAGTFFPSILPARLL